VRPADSLLTRVRSATSGDYTIERELGRGGMAAVFLGTDLALHRRVAIKVMLPELASTPALAERFVSEARTAANLDHAGIVTIHGVREREGLTFIVMKFIDGRTLDAVLKHEPRIPLAVAETLIGQVAEALHHAHLAGIVHRDVKPSNIILDGRGRPFVTDFGIAKVTTAPSTTMSGAFVGTPAYMSPEQCRGIPATAASDQYGLGVLAYELIARRRPFNGSLYELIHAHVNEPVPPLTEVAPDVDPETAAIVHRMLEKDPGARFASLSEVGVAFLALAERRGERSAVQSAIVEMARGREAEHAEYVTLPFTSDGRGESRPGTAPTTVVLPEPTRGWSRPLIGGVLALSVAVSGIVWRQSRRNGAVAPPNVAALADSNALRTAAPAPGMREGGTLPPAPATNTPPASTPSAGSQRSAPPIVGDRTAKDARPLSSPVGGGGAAGANATVAAPPTTSSTVAPAKPNADSSGRARVDAPVPAPEATRSAPERAPSNPGSMPANSDGAVGAVPPKSAETRPSCGTSGAAELSLLQALSGDVPKALDALYRPIDPNDAKLKSSTLEQLRAGTNHRVTVNATRGEEGGDVCIWAMRLRIAYTNAFHQERERTLAVRAQARNESGRTVMKQLSGNGTP
jgi:tRNA A-37 threonylcarbamoyl transferase component Bud32